MPYVGDGDDFQSARKRRWDDDHDGSVYRLYNPDKQQPDIFLFNPAPDFAASRKTLPLCSKRARITPNDDHSAPHYNSPNTFAPTHRRRASQQQKVLQEQSGLGNRASVPPPSAALLLPCHICHRRPTKKCDLDSFAGCQGCGERACFVCIRLCHGCNADDGMSVLSEQEVLSRSFHMDDADEPRRADEEQDCRKDRHDDTRPLYRSCENGGRDGTKGWAASGHRSVVCSRCCVERGPEGEVVCLGCLSGMPGA